MKDSAKIVAVVIVILVVASLVVVINNVVTGKHEKTVTVTVTKTLTTTKTASSTPASPSTTETSTNVARTVYLKLGGATFPAPQYLRWIKEFMEEYPNIKLSYELLGSGAGVARFFDGTLDVAGSDPPLSHDVWAKHEGEVMQVPTLVGAVVVIYNIPGLNDVTLNLSGRVLALIYKGDIKYWDDERIEKLNPGVKLPHHEIFVVFRADASGTQQIFTTFLHKAAPDVWPLSLVGKAPAFPVAKTGRAAGGKGNPGVANLVKNNPYSIGFVEWNYAIENHLRMAALENAAGHFILPSTESLINAAEAAAKYLPNTPLGDFSKDEDYIIYSKGEYAYPLVAWTHLVLRTHYDDPAKAEAIATLLKWIAEKGEKNVIAGYAPVPDQVRQMMIYAANKILGKA